MTTATTTLTGREYLRVSQDRSGTSKSPDQQHDENAHAFPGALGEPYREPGSASASRYARKAREVFTGLLSDLTTGDFGSDALVLWESSRGSRTVGEWVNLLDACEAHKIGIFVTTHGRLYDPANARDRRTLLEDAVDSEYESAKSSARIRRNTAATAATGKPHGRVLFGYERIYDYDPRGVRTFREQVIREDQAVIVRESAARLLSGDSCYGIAKRLNKDGVPIPHKPINDRNVPEWNGAQIRRMLLNPGYNGKRVHRGQVVGDASWPAILDDETFVSVTRILNDPARKQIKDGAVKHLLTGILTCQKCKRISRVMPQRGGYKAYHCKGFCSTRRQDFVDNYIEELVIARLSDPEVLKALSPAEDDGPDVFAAIEKKRTMIDEMEELVFSESLSPASFARMEKRALAEIEELERQARKNSVSPVVHELAGPDAEEKWNAADVTRQREVIRALFADIQMVPVPPEHRGRRGFDETLIVPVWVEGLERLPVRRRLTPVPPLEGFPLVGKRARVKARAASAPGLSSAQLDKIARALDN